jgi:hypothetical protein
MHRLSLHAYLLCAALLVAAAVFYYPKWEQKNTEATISWDVSGYYLYLPAALIYKDLKQLEWWSAIAEKYHPGPGMGQAFRHHSGNYVMKYPMGQALQFLPWFAAAHLLAEPLGYPADGFSKPYQAAISWGSLLIALFGLWMLRRVLRQYFSEGITAATLLSIVFGSNYFEYASMTGAMTHNWLFTLYTCLIFSTMRFYSRPTLGWAAAIGLLVGWAALTRPSEIISALIPIFWGITSWATARARLVFFQKHFPKIPLAVAVAGAVLFLQAAYWKWAAGEWFVYSYEEQGFSWLRPHFADVLFSARAGWIVYSPMMIFAVLGFLLRNPAPDLPMNQDRLSPNGRGAAALIAPLRRETPLPVGPGVGLIIYCLTALYVVAAWDIWWYGGSLGQRAMVQSYPMLSFPLAAFWHWVSSRDWRRWVFVPLAGACVYLNLWWSHQAHRGGLFVTEQMTKRYMLKVLGRFEAERDWLKFLDVNEEFHGVERHEVRTVFSENFEADTTGIATAESPIAGLKSLIINKEKQFSPEFELPLQAGETGWLRAAVTFRSDPKEWDWWRMAQCVLRFRAGDKIVKERMIRLQRHVDGSEPKSIFFDVRIPAGFDRATLLFWNADSDKAVRLDDLKVEVFK